jgi:hypothetical protein
MVPLYQLFLWFLVSYLCECLSFVILEMLCVYQGPFKHQYLMSPQIKAHGFHRKCNHGNLM